jgi:hypothetical protein
MESAIEALAVFLAMMSVGFVSFMDVSCSAALCDALLSAL